MIRIFVVSFVDGGFNKTNRYLRNGVSLETPFLLYD